MCPSNKALLLEQRRGSPLKGTGIPGSKRQARDKYWNRKLRPARAESLSGPQALGPGFEETTLLGAFQGNVGILTGPSEHDLGDR